MTRRTPGRSHVKSTVFRMSAFKMALYFGQKLSKNIYNESLKDTSFRVCQKLFFKDPHLFDNGILATMRDFRL